MNRKALKHETSARLTESVHGACDLPSKANPTRQHPKPSIRWLGAAEVSARYAHVNVTTLRRWTAKGLLPPPLRMGGLMLWNEAELDAADALKRRNDAALMAAKTRVTPARDDNEQ
jgi:predicted DNA-binding transcriptional regulator AlpA